MTDYTAKPVTRQEVPLQIALIGPPGGGKTYSALLLATGMQRARPGPIVMIDTERRSRGYHKAQGGEFDFLLIELEPPFRPSKFLDAVKAQLKLNPAAIIIDSASDEHEGPGGVLEWHDDDVPRMGGNDWAAWAKPKADRKKMLGGLRQITVPLICCFRGREKTEQREVTKNGRTKMEPVNIGWVPIAPLEFVHTMDLTCLLPSSAEGLPVWRMSRTDKHEGDENSPVLKMVPAHLKRFAVPRPLSADLGEHLARWAMGGTVAAKPPEDALPKTRAALAIADDLADGDLTFADRWDQAVDEATVAADLHRDFSQAMKTADWDALKDAEPARAMALKAKVTKRVAELKVVG